MKRAKAHLITLMAILTTALLAASPAAATAGKRSAAAVEPAAGSAGHAGGMELRIRSAKVANDGSLQLEFTLKDRKGTAIKGLTRRDVAEVSFGRLGYEDEVGLRNVVGKPEKVWLSYFDRNRDRGISGNRAVAGLGDKERLTEKGDGSYTLQVSNPARLLTKFSYSATAETGVVLRIKRGDGMQGSDAYCWLPALGKRIEVPEMLARQGGRPSGQRPACGVEVARQARLQ